MSKYDWNWVSTAGALTHSTLWEVTRKLWPGLQDVPGVRLLPSFPSQPTVSFNRQTAGPNFLSASIGLHPTSVILGGKLGDRGI